MIAEWLGCRRVSTVQQVLGLNPRVEIPEQDD